MTMNGAPDHLPLAAEFPAASYAQWRKLVDNVLKGAPYDRTLVAKTYDGLAIEPLQARAAEARMIGGRAPGAHWEVMQRVDHPDSAVANAEALHDLANGATGLTYVCTGSVSANGYGLDASAETLARVLDGVVLDAGIAIDFNLSPQTRNVVRHFAALVKSRNIAPASVNMRASVNPLGGFAAAGKSPQPWEKLAQSLTALARELAGEGFHGPFAVADGRIIHNAGGSEAQELAFAIASAVAYLRAFEAGSIPLDAARDMIYFRLSADADQFLTMAKFRAVRQLWARVEEACGLAPKPVHVAAETAWRMMTRRDTHVNMLRATIAVFSAGLGGADSITVLPHTAPLGLPDRFARRIARNTQLILLEEAGLAKVADPAAGSGGIEELTRKLCAAAWSLFQEIEQAGGAWLALEAGLIQRKVAAVRAERMRAVARGVDALIGTSEFADLDEEPVAVLDIAPVTPPPDGAAVITAEPLPRIRLAEPFERLRDASDRMRVATGARPKIFLANLGGSAEFAARATFAKNFFAAGGIEAIDEGEFANREVMAAGFRRSGARLACLCGTDGAYAREAADVAQALTAAGARQVYVADGPRSEIQEQLIAVATTIFAGCDVLAILRAAHDILGIACEPPAVVD
jgi:methylmalonyl-CoA mutase